jgi:hypothetical protein
MLLRIVFGQGTPGHSTAEAVAFEQRINQRYVDFLAGANWDYLGVYAVDGLVPGAFAEVLPVPAADPEEALRWDSEHEAGGLPDDVAAFYAECRSLFWQRGSVGFWLRIPDDAGPPARGEAIRLTFLASVTPDSYEVVRHERDQPGNVVSVKFEMIGRDLVMPTDELLVDDIPELPTEFNSPLILFLRPLVPAPERSGRHTGVAAV